MGRGGGRDFDESGVVGGSAKLAAGLSPTPDRQLLESIFFPFLVANPDIRRFAISRQLLARDYDKPTQASIGFTSHL